MNYKVNCYKKNNSTLAYNRSYKNNAVIGLYVYNIFQECNNSFDSFIENIIFLILAERICLECSIHNFNYKKLKFCKSYKKSGCKMERIAKIMLEE